MKNPIRLASVVALLFVASVAFSQTSVYTLKPGGLYVFGWDQNEFSADFTLEDAAGNVVSQEFVAFREPITPTPFPEFSMLAQDGADGLGTYPVSATSETVSNGVWRIAYPTKNGGAILLSIVHGPLCTGCRRIWWHITSATYVGPEL